MSDLHRQVIAAIKALEDENARLRAALTAAEERAEQMRLLERTAVSANRHLWAEQEKDREALRELEAANAELADGRSGALYIQIVARLNNARAAARARLAAHDTGEDGK